MVSRGLSFVLSGVVGLASLSASAQATFFDKAFPKCEGSQCNVDQQLEWSMAEISVGAGATFLVAIVDGGTASNEIYHLQLAAQDVENAKGLFVSEEERKAAIIREQNDFRNLTVDSKSGARVLNRESKKRIEGFEKAKLVNPGYKEGVIDSALENYSNAESALRRRLQSVGIRVQRLVMVGGLVGVLDGVSHIFVMATERSANPTPLAAISKQAYEEIVAALNSSNGTAQPQPESSAPKQQLGSRLH